jgi:hypothetical protein
VTTTAPIGVQNPWLNPLPNTETPALSERLIRALEAHVAAEAYDAATCQELTQRTADPVVGLLVGLIVDDEQRHQSLLTGMIRRLQQEVDFVPSATAIPVDSEVSAADPELVAALRTLIRDQHEGARYLRHIARQEPALYEGLYATLLETMARDGEKHVTILRFLLRRLEEQLG